MPQSDEAVVFDASTVLAIILREPGYQAIVKLERRVMVSAVNLAEVRSRLWDKEGSEKAINQMIKTVRMSVVDFDAEQANLAADLRPKTRALGLSLGDRACLALGILKKAVVYTADRAWSKLDLPVTVIVMR